jgi:hypothetical protein
MQYDPGCLCFLLVPAIAEAPGIAVSICQLVGIGLDMQHDCTPRVVIVAGCWLSQTAEVIRDCNFSFWLAASFGRARILRQSTGAVSAMLPRKLLMWFQLHAPCSQTHMRTFEARISVPIGHHSIHTLLLIRCWSQCGSDVSTQSVRLHIACLTCEHAALFVCQWAGLAAFHSTVAL